MYFSYFRDIITRILLDRIHPLGYLMCQMQYAVLDKVNPIITKHQSLLVKRPNIRFGNENCIDARHKILSSIDRDLCNLSMDHAEDFGPESKESPGARETSIAEEEQEAFRRHFHNISAGKVVNKLITCHVCRIITNLQLDKSWLKMGREYDTYLTHVYRYPSSIDCSR